MKKIIFALLLCLFATNVFCAVDGKMWLRWDKYDKTNFLMGFGLCYSFICPTEKDVYPRDYDLQDIMDFTDNFYSNSQYKILDIPTVLCDVVFPALKYAWSKDEIDKRALELIKQQKLSNLSIGYANP